MSQSGGSQSDSAQLSSASHNQLPSVSSSSLPASSADSANKAGSQTDTADLMPVNDIYNKTRYQVEAVADTIEFDKTRNLLIAKGNVVLSHGDVRLTSDYAELDTSTNKALARGHVILFKGQEPTLKGSEVYYDFKNHHGNFPDGRFVSLPWRGTGVEVEQKKQGLHTIKNCSVTTCASENPNYEFRAQKATIYSGDKIVIRNIWLYIMGKKVLWLPMMVIPLNLSNVPFSVSAGRNSRFGYYVALMKGYYINKNLYGRVYLDWRSKKGFGGGLTQQYEFGQWAVGDVKAYWTQDKEAPVTGYKDPNGIENPYGLKEERDRGRLTWRHRSDFMRGTHLIGRFHRVADEFFLQDFFQREHRAEQQPSTFATLTHNTETYGTFVHVEKRINDFEKTIEHLPQVRADLKNQPVIVDGLYNQSQVSFDNLKKRIGTTGKKEDVVRSDAATKFYYPLKWNELKFLPSTGLRTTYYSREASEDNDHLRLVFETGFDLRKQYYKTMDTRGRKLGIEINQLRHVFEPNFQTAAALSTVQPQKLYTFDSLDKYGNTSRFQFGLDNRLQTKRVVRGSMQRVDLVSLNTFVRYDFQPLDRRGSAWTTLGNTMTLRPYSWLLYETKVEHDIERGQVQTFSQDVVFIRDRWRLLFSHRYADGDQLNRDDIYLDSFGNRPTDGNQFVFEGRYTINPLWTVGGYTRWNASHGNFEEWQVNATRNLGCDLLLDFGFNMRDSLIESSNTELFFNLRMQTIPGVHLGAGGNVATVSTPRIGETVDGSNEQTGYFSSSYSTRYSPDAYLY